MSLKKSLPWIGLAAVGVYAASRWIVNTTQSVGKLTYGNPQIKITDVGLLNTKMEIRLDITNPASVDIPLDYFTGNVNYMGKKLSSFTFNANGANVLVKARSVTTLPFNLIVSNINALGDLVKLVEALATGGDVSTVLNVTGSFYAAGYDVPVSFNYDLKTQSVVSGIGSVKATLEFGNNSEMEKYFTVRRIAKKMEKNIMFSKN